MTAVETLWRPRHHGYMASTPPPHVSVDQQLQAMGRAIKALRVRSNPGGKEPSQEIIAARIGVGRQAWQLWETGQRQTILRSDTQDMIARALETTREALLMEYERQLGRAPAPGRWGQADTPAHEPRQFEISLPARAKAGKRAPVAYDFGEPESTMDMAWMFGPNGSALRVAGDSMTGYVESGQIVIFDRSRWPTRGEGCVIETTDGELYVKEYVAQEGAILRVRQRFPEETLEFPMAEVRGVYAVRLRGF